MARVTVVSWRDLILKEISHFKYDDDLESTGGARFQTNHADNRIRVVDIAVCKTSKAICHRYSDGRVPTGLCRLHNSEGWWVFHRRLEGIRVILILDPLSNNVSQIHGKERKYRYPSNDMIRGKHNDLETGGTHAWPPYFPILVISSGVPGRWSVGCRACAFCAGALLGGGIHAISISGCVWTNGRALVDCRRRHLWALVA
ncbi:hypothetical protein V8E53_002297 [Lactarius tabidus]